MHALSSNTVFIDGIQTSVLIATRTESYLCVMVVVHCARTNLLLPGVSVPCSVTPSSLFFIL